MGKNNCFYLNKFDAFATLKCLGDILHILFLYHSCAAIFQDVRKPACRSRTSLPWVVTREFTNLVAQLCNQRQLWTEYTPRAKGNMHKKIQGKCMAF